MLFRSEEDLAITVLDPQRAGHEFSYYPGEVSLRKADVAIINKIDSADETSIKMVENSINEAAPNAVTIKAESEITVDDPELITDKKVLVVEDGPTLTHGGMEMGAGHVIAERLGAKEFVDPRPFAVGDLIGTFEKYQEIGNVLPAMGYGEKQLKDLEETINSSDCDTVIIGTPMDLSRVINLKKPYTRVNYELKEVGSPNLDEVLLDFIEEHHLKK